MLIVSVVAGVFHVKLDVEGIEHFAARQHPGFGGDGVELRLAF